MYLTAVILLILSSYLLGSFPTAYIFVKLIKGEDIRDHGSGNVGATNAARVLGKKIAKVEVLSHKVVKELITKLDVDKQQVYVQARIIEVSETRTNNLGVQYGLNGFHAGSGGLMTFSSALNSGTSPALDLSALSTYGYDLGNLKNGLSLGATINLLKQNKALDIVSEPSILCINNKESSIYVGETRSIPTGTTVGTTTTTNYKREDIGLKLKVKPRISSDEKVVLDIKTVLEDVLSNKVAGLPTTTKREVKTLWKLLNLEKHFKMSKEKKETLSQF